MEKLVKKKQHRFLSIAMVGVTVFLSACGDKQEIPPPKAAVDQLSPRYESTLAEGIDFKKPGYPPFLIDVVGVSGREDWGRWTDANFGPDVKFRFNKPLPKKFILELQAHAYGPNEGKQIKIRAGNIERTVIIKNLPSHTVWSVEFDDVVSADTIEITPPNPVLPREIDPNSKDGRKLGLGLVALKIRTIQ
jgi:phosphoglycerol transferase